MRILIKILGWSACIFVLVLLVLVATNRTRLGLTYASLSIEGKPDAFPPIADRHRDVLANREMWQRRLETHIFGPFPKGVSSRLISHTVVDKAYLHGLATLEEYLIEIRGSGETREFTLAIAWPDTDAPAPVIISQSFCGNQTVFRRPDLSPPAEKDVSDFCGGGETGVMSRVIQLIFGRYIASPPMEDVLSRGYAYASFYTSELIPDSAGPARALMPNYPHGPRGEITGTISGWAAGFSAALDVLEADRRTDPARTAIIGHSRSAKSALVAGTYDQRIDAIIAHQAGTGGTALSRDKPGETVEQIVDAYPHWFDPAYANFDAEGANTTPVDMHVLIALNGPTPLLVGNGRRDVWSDPNGSWRATLEAAPVYEATGTTGLMQEGMQDANLEADLVFWMRRGGHSITARDWEAWLTWLDNIMPQGDPVPAGENTARVSPHK